MVGKTVIWKRSECAVHGRRRRRYVVEFPSSREDVRGVAGATLIFQDLFYKLITIYLGIYKTDHLMISLDR